MTTVISVENLGKRYLLSHQSQKQPYVALRDVIAERANALGRRLLNPFRSSPLATASSREDFWALNDVSFEISEGDRVGIIGRNGAGKSTLLKVLSRIVEPTTGRVRIRGRVASLLEVGTGFHPELTGRENIFLNGAILGMTRAEIRKKFDEIVDFAEIEKFLDTPVKRYSSGMYVRLAFAVAAHLEPEILLIDEVLAVGDAQFQKKCLGKMEDVSKKEGRTVLFVSHHMGTIAQLCTKAILLNRGSVVRNGPVSDVVSAYMSQFIKDSSRFDASSAVGKDIAIIKAQAFDEQGNQSTVFTHNQVINIAIVCRVNHWVGGAEVRIGVRDSKRNVFTTDTELTGSTDNRINTIVAKATIPANLLRPETYFLTLATYIPNQVIIDLIRDALSITVIDGGSKYAASEGLDYGCVFVDCCWTVEPSSDHE